MTATEGVRYEWKMIDDAQIGSWDKRLSETQVPFAQYPFWNEAYRSLKISPIYLVCCVEGSPVTYAYVCILSIRVPGFRIGFVQKGPVTMLSNGLVDVGMLESLKVWATSEGFMCLRFMHFDPDFLERVKAVPSVLQEDAFPMWSGLSKHALLVDIRREEAQILAGFQAIARRDIKAAEKVGYEIATSDDPAVLLKNWGLFEALAERKGTNFFPRPVESWAEMIRQGRHIQGVSLHTASLRGKIIQAILVVRDAETAEYMIGALDLESLEGEASPSCLLHWHAMREARSKGCSYYNLGHPSGVVYQFKKKFRPEEVVAPPSVTMVIRPYHYWLWTKFMLEMLVPLWPMLRSILSKLRPRRLPTRSPLTAKA